MGLPYMWNTMRVAHGIRQQRLSPPHLLEIYTLQHFQQFHQPLGDSVSLTQGIRILGILIDFTRLYSRVDELRLHPRPAVQPSRVFHPVTMGIRILMQYGMEPLQEHGM